MSTVYALHQTLLSLSGDAWIEDSDGNRVFEVDGKAFALGRTLDLLGRNGAQLYRLHQPVVSFRPKFEISRDGAVVATIEKALLALFGDRYSIELADGSMSLEAKGDFLDHEFSITRDGVEVIQASRRWFSMHDTYGVQIADGFDTPLALTIVIAIEQMEHQEDEKQRSGPLSQLP